MAFKQIVTLKGQKDGIDIILDPNADFDDIQDALRKKVAQGRRFFDGADIRVSFKGRELDELGEKILIDIISEETNLDITFVQADDYVAPPPGRSLVHSYVPVTYHHNSRQSMTEYHFGGLRSGQSIRYSGSVVVLGDVNPGSEVIADGNVVVLGALKGMAHAGAAGDEACFVSALHLRPTQLRIAGYISYVPADITARRNGAYAYVRNGQVFIGPL